MAKPTEPTKNKSKSSSIASEAPNKGKKMAKAKKPVIWKYNVTWTDGTRSMVYGETWTEALAASGKASLYSFHNTIGKA